jgi:lipid II:glycine glycyltransferase (peptidoglycan interpeptide bridge formation enzyme)
MGRGFKSLAAHHENPGIPDRVSSPSSPWYSARVSLRAVPVKDPLEWDTLVTSFRHHSALQGWGFGEARRVTSWEPVRLRLERDGVPFAAAQVLRRKQYGLGFLYCPRGPALNDLADLEDVGKLLNDWAGFGDVSVTIEPPMPILSSGDPSVIPSSLGVWVHAAPIQPEHTVLIDVTQSEDALLKHMHEMARRNTKTSLKEGVTASVEVDFDAFWTLFSETNARSQLLQRHRRYYEAMYLECRRYGGDAQLITARKDGVPLATGMVIGLGDELCYLYGGSTRLERKEGERDPKASNGFYWGMLKYAHERGYKRLDLFGIPRVITAEKHSFGVYEFKMRLGGQMAYFPAYELPLNPLSSLVNRALRWRKDRQNLRARGTTQDVL